MPRYEFVQGTSSKFWEITLDGSEFTTTYGKIGTDGKSTTKSFDGPEQAQKEYEKLIGQKTKKGYVLAGGAEAPQDGKERLHGLEQETQGGNDEPAERFVFRPVVTYDPEKGLGQAGRGAAYAVRLEEPWDQGLEEFLGLLDQLLADPRVGELKALVLGCWGSEYMTDGEGDPQIYQRLLAAKDRLGSLSAVFMADVTQEENECSWINLNDYGQLLALPALEHLRVRGNGSPQAPLQSPTLRSLCLQTGGLPRTTAQAVASASFPELEHLELWLGTDNYGGNTTPDDLAPILSGKLFPKLRYLGLRNADQADAFAQAVATSPVLEQLEVLDFSLGALTNAGAEALLSSPALSKLKRLNLHQNYLDDATRKKVKALGIECDVDRGDAEEEDYGDGEVYRYISLTE